MAHTPDILAPEVSPEAVSDRDLALWEAEMDRPPDQVELVMEPNDELSELESIALQEEPGYRSPDFEAGHSVTEQEYNMMLMERLSVIGRDLDKVRGSITTEEAAEEWLELKMATAAAKGLGDVYTKVDVVIELEMAAYYFIRDHGLYAV